MNRLMATAVLAMLAFASPASAETRAACLVNRAWVVWTGTGTVNIEDDPVQKRQLNFPFYLLLNQHTCFEFEAGRYRFAASSPVAGDPDCSSVNLRNLHAGDVTFRLDGTAGLTRCTELIGKNLN